MVQDYRTLWTDWSIKPVSERVARILAMKDAPHGFNDITKRWVDENYQDYETQYVAAILQECGGVRARSAVRFVINSPVKGDTRAILAEVEDYPFELHEGAKIELPAVGDVAVIPEAVIHTVRNPIVPDIGCFIRECDAVLDTRDFDTLFLFLSGWKEKHVALTHRWSNWSLRGRKQQ